MRRLFVHELGDLNRRDMHRTHRADHQNNTGPIEHTRTARREILRRFAIAKTGKLKLTIEL